VGGEGSILQESLVRLGVSHSRLVVAHLLRHFVLMAVVVHVLRSQFLGLSARGIDIAAGYLLGIAPRSGSVHRPGWILERHAASAHRDRESGRRCKSSDLPPESVDIDDLFLLGPPCVGACKGEGVIFGLTMGEFETNESSVGDSFG